MGVIALTIVRTQLQPLFSLLLLKMMLLRIMTMVLVVGVGLAERGTDHIVDMKRPCPNGFFYAGESTYRNLDKDKDSRSVFYEKGSSSPVYGCYKIEKDLPNWAEANQRCWDQDSQLISVDNAEEDKLIARHSFLKHFDEDGNEPDFSTIHVATSGVDLGQDDWTWFATGKPIDSNITEELTQTPNASGAQCLLVSWRQPSEDHDHHHHHHDDDDDAIVLKYSYGACMSKADFAVCEMRVYVQTWYVWFFNNWLQLLFLFSLVLLLISSCLTLQVWTSRPRQRPAVLTSEIPATANNNMMNPGNNKYVEKSKELLAKVVFYTPKKPEDKEKLTSAA